MAAIKILATTFCLLASGAAFADDPLPRAKPEDVGLSSERLARIGATLKSDIDAGRTGRLLPAERTSSARRSGRDSTLRPGEPRLTLPLGAGKTGGVDR